MGHELTKAMILAAGLGTRMRPLTLDQPKPLIMLAGKPLICHCIERIRAVGIKEIVINLGYHGDMIQSYIQDGKQWGVEIIYTREHPARLLGAGGGVKNALPYLGCNRFLLLSADIWTDYPLRKLCEQSLTGYNTLLGVENSAYYAQGDFTLLDGETRVKYRKENNVTFAGVGVFTPQYFAQIEKQVFSLMPVIKASIDQQLCYGIKITAPYRHVNIGTPQQLLAIQKEIWAAGM